MKKLILFFFAASFILTSCSSDNDDTQNANDIVGIWTGESVEYSGTSTTTFLGESITSTFIGESFNEAFTVAFAESPNQVVADGTFSLELTVTTEGEVQTEILEDLEFLDNGTWSVSGDKLFITSDGETSEATIVELTNTLLVLKVVEEEDVEDNGLVISTDIEAIVTLSRN